MGSLPTSDFFPFAYSLDCLKNRTKIKELSSKSNEKQLYIFHICDTRVHYQAPAVVLPGQQSPRCHMRSMRDGATSSKLLDH